MDLMLHMNMESSAIPGLIKSIIWNINYVITILPRVENDTEAMGFKWNPYDPYAANKTICDKIMTITWHVN